MAEAQFDVKTYLFVLKKSWALSMLVFLLVLTGGVLYCLFWPPVYQTSCLVVVQPQKVPDNIIKPTVTSDIQDRLQIITQKVLSRTRLTEIIERFDLYPEQRKTSTPDGLAEFMRKNIEIRITRKNYFTITYTYGDPETVAAVTNALAAFYVDSNLRLREEDAVGTARFLQREMERMQSQLTEYENNMAAYRAKHMQELPESRWQNIGLLNKLHNHYQYLLGAVLNTKSRLTFYEGQIIETKRFIEALKQRKAETRLNSGAGDSLENQGASTPEELKAQIEQMLIFYKPDHPDIRRMQRVLAKLEAQRKAEEEARRKALIAQGLDPNKVEAQEDMDQALAKRQADIELFEARIQQATNEIKAFEDEMRANKEMQDQVEARINNSPLVAEELNKLGQGYDELKESYKKMHAKWLEASMSANLERTQRGEQFQVVDPAEIPDAPFRPNVSRALPVAAMLAVALALGLAFSISFLDTSYSSVAAIEKDTSLPVLVVMPALLTHREKARKRRQNVMLATVYSGYSLVLLALIAIMVLGKGGAIKDALMSLVA